MAWLPIPLLARQTPMTLLALACVGVVAWVLYRTPLGLAVRAVGENPAAAEGQGLDVNAITQSNGQSRLGDSVGGDGALSSLVLETKNK